MKYNKKFIDTQDVKELAEKYHISLLLASILVRREITRPEDIKFFLQDETRYLHNPFCFRQMEDAVDRILDAAAEGEKVMVFGDRDADGITSTVLITQKLSSMGIETLWKVPEGDEPYGLTKEAVDYAASMDVTLIITVDCGISNKEEIAYGAELGIDTVVLDHHTAPEELPECVAVIDPKIPDCGYPFRDLAGCGVVSKVIWALEFAATGYYKQSVTLLHIRQGVRGTYIFEAVKLCNLAEVARVREVIVPDILKGPESTRLMNFLTGSYIYTFGAREQKAVFSEIFPNTELQTLDFASEVYKLYPQLQGMGLLRMREMSLDSRYKSGETSEIDIFVSLFRSVFYSRYQNLSSEYEKILPLVALGSVADLMPLKDENRIMVRKGLRNMISSDIPGLHELLVRQKLIDRTITTADIAWYVSPVINASGRMGVPSKAVRLFLSRDIAEVKLLADEILSLNKQRKKLGEEYWDKLHHSAKESMESYSSSLLCTGGKGVPRGITGILAARFSNYYNVPSIIYSIMDDKAVGSVRSVRNYSIMPLLDYCRDFFIDYGGHDFAGGFSLKADDIDSFRKHLLKFTEEEGIEIPDKPAIEIDAELPEGYLTEAILDVAEKLVPYGESNPPLFFLAKKLVIKVMDIVGQKESGHLKFTLDSGKNLWPAIFWNSSDRVKEFSVGDRVNVIFRIENNFFRNKVTPQLVIQDMERV